MGGPSRDACAACRKETSVTAGTIFHGSRLPLQSWFAAIWYVVNPKQGVSALGLQRVLGFRSYQTAWAWLHKLRRAMVLPGRELLAGASSDDVSAAGLRELGNGRHLQHPCGRGSRNTCGRVGGSSVGFPITVLTAGAWIEGVIARDVDFAERFDCDVAEGMRQSADNFEDTQERAAIQELATLETEGAPGRRV